jgi:pyrroline-5-carboxylate reductase
MGLKVALVGCGAMGSALLKGWLSLPDSLKRFEKIWVIAPHRDKVEPFLKDKRVQWIPSPQELFQSPDCICFAVKPYLLEEILPSYQSFDSLFMTMATGKSLAFYQSFLGLSSIVRVMPNTPVGIHQGIIGLWMGRQPREIEKILIDTCLGALGVCLWVTSDDELDRLTAISGSGPAYVFALIEALAGGAESLGFDQKTALSLAIHTFLGASLYANQSEESPSVLRERVTSPQGTTAEALRVFEQEGLKAMMEKAVKSAYTRAKEL